MIICKSTKQKTKLALNRVRHSKAFVTYSSVCRMGRCWRQKQNSCIHIDQQRLLCTFSVQRRRWLVKCTSLKLLYLSERHFLLRMKKIIRVHTRLHKRARMNPRSQAILIRFKNVAQLSFISGPSPSPFPWQARRPAYPADTPPKCEI